MNKYIIYYIVYKIYIILLYMEFNTNNEYRKYLINNANNIIKYNQLSVCNDTNTLITTDNKNRYKHTNTPYLYYSVNDNYKPLGYNDSDLKSVYISRQELESRLHTPYITQDELLKNYYKRAN